MFARKCGIDFDELEADAKSLLKHFNDGIPEPFLPEDIEAALEAHDENYVTFPRKKMESISAIEMPANKRNGRPQKTHMQIVSATRDVDYPNGLWRKNNGRKSKASAVQDYRLEHPDETNKSKVARELGLSRPTVTKHWDADILTP
jgi:hypothetical protein